MSKEIVPDFDRLLELRRRQGVIRWDSSYLAGIYATREEAPKYSRPSQVPSMRFDRYLHALSHPERWLLVLIEYRGGVRGLFEQHVCPTVPREHELATLPGGAERRLNAYRGSVVVAEELGFLSFHPVVYDSGTALPFPYIDDVLVCLGDAGDEWSVNFSVKDEPEDFERPFAGGRQARDQERAILKVRARHAIGEQVFADVGTPTVRVTSVDFANHRVFIENIDWALKLSVHLCNLTKSQVKHCQEAFVNALERNEPALCATKALEARHDIPYHESRIVFARMLFSKALNVNMSDERIFFDRPLKTAQVDPLGDFEHWFHRRGVAV
jgi:hypothetical protein